MQTQILTFNSENLKKCADEILSGGIVAFPTETVYGLGANALDENAVKKIYVAKGRPSDNPLICHVSNKAQIEKLGDVTPFARKIIDAFMPGPITVVLSKKNCVSGVVTGGLNTVGVRMPDHEVARTFIAECGVPLCAPSANTSTKPSPTQAKYVFDDLNGKIRYILDGGNCRVGIESTIVDCVNKRILRKGGVSEEQIEAVVGKLGKEPIKSDVPLCPGMKYKHYSPDAEVYLAKAGVDMTKRICDFYDKLVGKKIIFSLKGDYGNRNVVKVGDTVVQYAENVFALFREADKSGYRYIICEGVEDCGIGAALLNRLNKSSGGKTI